MTNSMKQGYKLRIANSLVKISTIMNSRHNIQWIIVVTIIICNIGASTVVFSQVSTLPDTITADYEIAKQSAFGLALNVSTSTNGVGASMVLAANKRWALRLGYEFVDFSLSTLTYDIDGQKLEVLPSIKSGGFAGIIDFYLFKNLYMSGGVVYSAMDISILCKSAESLKMGDIEFKPDNIGQLQFAIQPDRKLSPYLGLGFGRNISRDRRVAFSVELGAYHMGSYKVDVVGTELFESNNSESVAELNKTLREISWSGIYPIFKIALSYRFF